MEKALLRKQMLQLRAQLRPHFIENSARRIGGQIAALPAFQEAGLTMLYHSYRQEAGTLPLLTYCLRTKKPVALPVTDDDLQIHPYLLQDMDQLCAGPLGIPQPDPQLCQPADPSRIDLVVVPGLVFDENGSRIGYGKGCYDRFLPQLRADVPVIAMAYDFQILPRIPQEATDRPMDLIVTEKGILDIPGSKLSI